MLIALVLLLSATAVFADSEPLRTLDFMAGSWQCTGDVFATPMAPARKSVATVETKWGHDGHWLAFTYAEKKTAEAPMPVTFSGYMGYDPELKKYVVGGVDSMGGYSTSQSDGMTGDSLVFVGPWHMGTMTANGRDTFIHKSERELVHIGEVEMEGKFVKYGQETCWKK